MLRRVVLPESASHLSLGALAKSKHLKTLVLSLRTQTAFDAFEKMRGHKFLKTLVLALSKPLSKQAASSIASMPNLEYLRLPWQSKIEDFELVADSKSLKVISCSSTEFTGSQLLKLKKPTSLLEIKIGYDVVWKRASDQAD